MHHDTSPSLSFCLRRTCFRCHPLWHYVWTVSLLFISCVCSLGLHSPKAECTVLSFSSGQIIVPHVICFLIWKQKPVAPTFQRNYSVKYENMCNVPNTAGGTLLCLIGVRLLFHPVWYRRVGIQSRAMVLKSTSFEHLEQIPVWEVPSSQELPVRLTTWTIPCMSRPFAIILCTYS